MDLYERERKEVKKEEFSNNYDEKKLIDLNKTGIVKKRTREEVNLVGDNLCNETGKIAKIVENGTSKIINTTNIINTANCIEKNNIKCSNVNNKQDIESIDNDKINIPLEK